MRYQIVSLLAGERRTIGLEAADAASALAARPIRPCQRFELLAVLRADGPPDDQGAAPGWVVTSPRDGDPA